MTREKTLAAAAYLLGLPGIVVARLCVGRGGREDSLRRHHLRRAAELWAGSRGLLAAWLVVIHVLTLIPWVGFPLGVMLFALVLAAQIFMLALSVTGVVKAFRGERVAFPFVTAKMERLDPLFRRVGL